MTTSHSPRALREVGRDLQASALPARRDELFQTRLDDRATAGLDLFDLLTVDVDADDGVPKLGEAGRGDRANVSKSNDYDNHVLSSEGPAGCSSLSV